MADRDTERTLPVIKDAPATFRSDVWTNFGFYELDGKLDKTHTVCKVCHTKLKYFGNTTNMSKHFERFHPARTSSAIATKTASTSQPTIKEALTTLPSASERGKKITRSVACFISKDLRPYSVVENAGFRYLLKTLEPWHNLPTRRHFTETVVPALYNETKAQVMESMSKASRVAITCDSWMSTAKESYVTITAHYISSDWQLVSHVLQTRALYESHTGANLAELLSEVVDEWHLADKDIVLVTDNASNMIRAAEVGKFPQVKCFTHTLNLAAQRALKLQTVSRLLGRICRVSTFFHHSTIANHQLQSNQKHIGLPTHKLKTDVATRWNSAHDMMERYLEQQPAIHAALLRPQVTKDDAEHYTLNKTELENAAHAVKALRPMKDVTTLMSEEKNPTVCLISPLYAQLLQDMSDTTGDSPVIREIKNAIKTDLLKRYNSEEEKKLLYTASALYTRFKGLPFLTADERLRSVVTEAAALEETEADEMPAGAMNSGIQEEDMLCVEDNMHRKDNVPSCQSAAKRKASSSLLVTLLGHTFTDNEAAVQNKTSDSRAEEEVHNYCRAPSLPLTENPLNWWHGHEFTFPLLSKLSKRYLCIPGTNSNRIVRQMIGIGSNREAARIAAGKREPQAISCLEDKKGQSHYESKKLVNIMADYYKQLYASDVSAPQEAHTVYA
nr:E3 SUMO-protein ligase ZBED1-like [Nothobranchius furzeri]